MDDKIWELALQARKEQEKSEKNSEVYFCGSTIGKKGKLIIHVARLREDLPKGVTKIHVYKCAPNNIMEMAESILNKIPEPKKQKEKLELKPGTVAVHSDLGFEHMSIILKIRENGRVPCLVFTSSPEWKRGGKSRKHRLATTDEIALAGMVTTKTTYLTSSVKYLSEFEPTGVEFPMHRVHDLYREFFED